MKIVSLGLFLITLTGLATADGDSLLKHRVRTIDGEEKVLSGYEGKVLLVVNVASRCGYTSQYRGLQELHKKYVDQGLVVIGFPANDFGGQEPGSDSEIKEFCTTIYGVDFPMMSKVRVKGTEKHPFYKELTQAPGFEGEVQWNFEKFLIGRSGSVVGRFKSSVEPLDSQITSAIERELAR